MRDSEIVAVIVAGDPHGLAAAYDRYAAALHTYCRSLLAEPADAADAVQDTFVIAASGWLACGNRTGSGRGCTRWRATSATASSAPATGQPAWRRPAR